ncbi:hypothetical protein BDQ12DRAFT_686457 [Crucibulum laeve]|uniref:Uncharacterized protein n=1 Tax=Crucibulum laeve TaxID=68775 RepID=A0A5C3LWK4_9AGAR|nr:hypothetical protein BDQ12DRAFT_686457 [Crucibulum laeve]
MSERRTFAVGALISTPGLALPIVIEPLYPLPNHQHSSPHPRIRHPILSTIISIQSYIRPERQPTCFFSCGGGLVLMLDIES